MELFAVSIVVLVAVLSWFLWVRSGSRSHHRQLAPGPYPFPIIGNIHELGKHPHRSLTKLLKTYGPLMSLHLGSIYTVVVSSPEIAREILIKHGNAFSSRTIPSAMQAHDHNKMSMAYLPIGKEWRRFRKLSNEQMFTASRLECGEALHGDKLDKLREYVRERCEAGQAVNIAEATFITTLNLMSATLFSTEVTTFDSEGTQEFKKTIESIIDTASLPNFADFFPIFKPFDPQGIKRMAKIYFGKLLGFIEDLINQRVMESLQEKKTKKKSDLLETLLDLQQESDHEYDFMNIKVIKHFLLELFVAGSETTSSAVEWAMTELLLHPEILLKAKQEINSVAGDKKKLNESDIIGLPYLQAVIKEAFRYHPTGPLLIPRKSECDVQLASGYVIPKGTQVIVNVWAIGRDPAIWTDPEIFRPERFLDEKMNIDFKGNDFELIPFGAGRRICPGLLLANRMLHITVATLIHNFDWKFEVGDDQDHRAEIFRLALRKAVPLKAIPIKPSLCIN
ncbi:hypothetical protein ABFX02_05G071000 [Erythranthe guttata]